jgi:transmembrane sensor
MTDYQKFKIEQFASDAFFREWVLAPTPASESFWEEWIEANPDKQSDVRQARILVLAFDEKYKDNLSEETVAHEIEELVRLAEDRKWRNQPNATRFVAWRIAAIFIVFCGLGWLYYTNNSRVAIIGSKQQEESASEPMLVKVNNTDKEMTVLLSDNSVATLMKGSSLTYPSRFSKEERKVYLNGEAFFDITKNPSKPFLVFANETVTKVLGTSFRVKAFEKDPEVIVVVKTGRVSVYPQKEYEQLANDRDHEVSGVVLTPNQQVVFRKKENRLEKGIVANPGMLAVSADQKELIFDDRPVSEILHSLENIYGIVIVFDDESLSACVISTQFNEENLKQRMSVICQAIGATYEMIDGQIIVNSKGCS